jgi:hypothetical protein
MMTTFLWDVTPCSLVDHNESDIRLQGKRLKGAVRKGNVRNADRAKGWDMRSPT